MKLIDYWRSLTAPEQDAYAARAGSTRGYLKVHIMRVPPYKTSKPKLINGLADASEGAVSKQEVLSHFYGE